MLDEVALGIDYPGDDGHLRRRRVRLERRSLVLAPRIGEFEPDGANFGLIERRQHHFHRHVVAMRSFPVTPAHMQPHAVRRDTLERPVQCVDVLLDLFREFGVVGDIDAGLGLLFHDVGDAFPGDLVDLLGVDPLAIFIVNEQGA